MGMAKMLEFPKKEEFMSNAFVETNVNPMQRDTSDCYIRAISLALGKPYWKVAKALMRIWRKTGYAMNDITTISEYLLKHGMVRHDVHGMPLHELEERNPTGIFICYSQNHMSVVMGGKLYDVYNRNNDILLAVFSFKYENVALGHYLL